ncbi:MAG: LamB/YcsF family protein [Lachnospiraceae bacterium]|nr:LamB/YcsF family protein [Lachnospiraceae bacterium]
MKIDLNADIGESYGNYKCGLDEEVVPYISSANVACGFHAADPVVMDKTVSLAKEHGICVGAHPGFPDLNGFGRRKMAVTPKELKAMVQYQIGALNAFCKAYDMELSHVKPHGAMYNMAAKDKALALAIAEGIYEVDPSLILLGLSGSLLVEAAKETGLGGANEVFADRAYNDDGTLVDRSQKGAVITDEEAAIQRVIEMAKNGTVKSITGKTIEVKADSVCLHGDGEKAVEFARKINAALTAEGIEIVSMQNLLREVC